MQSNVIAEVSALTACSIIMLLLVGVLILCCGIAEYLSTVRRGEEAPISPPTEEGLRKEKRDNGRLIAMLGVFMLVIAFCLTFDAFH